MIHRHSLRVVLTDLAASAALLALDLAGRIADRRNPAPEPVEPAVESMPRQKVALFYVSEAEKYALVRAKIAVEMGTQPEPDVLRLIVAMHERAVRMELDQHADDFALWEAGR